MISFVVSATDAPITDIMNGAYYEGRTDIGYNVNGWLASSTTTARYTPEIQLWPGGYFTPAGVFYYITDWRGNKAQHVYEIFEIETEKAVKTGISGGKKTKDGTKSYRANRQVNKWNRDAGYQKFDSKITQDIPAGPGAREQALKAEEKNADRLRKKKELDPNYHIRP